MAEINTVDYLSDAIGRETTPFQSDELFEQILTLLLKQSSELQTSLVDISKYAGLDTATGNALDLIGELVGQERELPAEAADIRLLTYFGEVFLDQDQIYGGVVGLSDDAYRFFIRAKIISNTTKATPNEIISTASFLFDLPSVSYNELNASIYLGLGRKLNDTDGLVSAGINERAIAYLYIPRPAGVALYLSDYDPDDVFGFQGSSGSLGFGDLSDPSVGGRFASSFDSSGGTDPIEVVDTYYITVVTTEANSTLTLPITGEVVISWGDGYTDYATGTISHTYEETATHNITIYYTMNSLIFDNEESAKYVEYIDLTEYDAINTTSIANMFIGCNNLISTNIITEPDTYTTSVACLTAQKWVMVGSNFANRFQ